MDIAVLKSFSHTGGRLEWLDDAPGVVPVLRQLRVFKLYQGTGLFDFVSLVLKLARGGSGAGFLSRSRPTAVLEIAAQLEMVTQWSSSLFSKCSQSYHCLIPVKSLTFNSAGGGQD